MQNKNPFWTANKGLRKDNIVTVVKARNNNLWVPIQEDISKALGIIL